ncbi:MAG: DUF58 domain-containing protein [Bacteroidota bacterium]|jgi:uncharacterized protein (DUF58 family)
METLDLLKQVRAIEIRTKGLSNQIFSGEYHSAFKGRGMAFSEVREYIPGDDIRNIDWNVTARFNHPYVKVFEEERELTVMLLVDISGSGDFGTTRQFKRELITELCAVLAFSAIQNNDKTGVILFSDKVEKFIPPKKGRSHILRIIKELLEYKSEGKSTDIGVGLKYFSNMVKKRCIAFLISDFKSPDYSEALKVASRKHDLVAIRIGDQRERSFPDVGLIQFADTESGEKLLVDTSDSRVRMAFENRSKEIESATTELLNRSGVDHVRIMTGESYVNPLLHLFKRRDKRA